MFNYLYNNLEYILISFIISIIIILIYDLIRRNYNKIYFNILNLKVNIQNKDNWMNENNNIDNNTKGININFILEIYNHNNNYHSIYDIKILKKHKLKYRDIENNYLYLSSTIKSISGSNTYDKLKFITLLPFEVKDFGIIIKLTKDEYINIKKEPIYIIYKDGIKKRKIKLNKYFRKK